jgi:hypothetical protein
MEQVACQFMLMSYFVSLLILFLYYTLPERMLPWLQSVDFVIERLGFN